MFEEYSWVDAIQESRAARVHFDRREREREQMQKPRIKLYGRIPYGVLWVCVGRNVWGRGFTPAAAHADWKREALAWDEGEALLARGR